MTDEQRHSELTHSEPRPERRGGTFYGRRAGHTLKDRQREALGALDELRLDLTEPVSDLATLFDVPCVRFRVEIGFGGGEHLLHRAREAPGTGHVGVEPFVNGMASLLSEWVADPLPNLRLYDDDAVRVLDWLPAASIDHVDLLYPDPWRKRRHHKRRFVGPRNLDRLARVLKPGATFHFASDWAPYVTWTLKHVAAQPAFEAVGGEGERAVPFEGWPGTRYEAKAIREGRVPAYLRYRRVRGPDEGRVRGPDEGWVRGPDEGWVREPDDARIDSDRTTP